jgi:hypothetical protein
MPIAQRAAAIVAGILGGSGSHVFQIIIAIVVAAALISYFLLRIGGRGGGDARAVAAPVGQQDRANEGAVVGDATVRLVRTWSGIGIAAQSEWNIAIDGIVVGSIANKETVEVAVEPGHHTLRLGSGRHRSVDRSFDVAEDEVVGFSSHGPRIWPMLVAALINPDLWISLRPE